MKKSAALDRLCRARCTTNVRAGTVDARFAGIDAMLRQSGYRRMAATLLQLGERVPRQVLAAVAKHADVVLDADAAIGP